MKHNIIFLLFFGVWFNFKTEARSLKKDEIKDMSIPLNSYQATTFPYIHTIAEPRRSSHYQRYTQKSNPTTTTTTPRPFVSYWQNIVRNVRVPVPMITWNITNPLANLFHLEEQQELELPQQNDYYYHTRNQLRQKTKRRRKRPNKRHRKHKRPIVEITEEQQHEGHRHHHEQEQEVEEDNNQIILPQYPISDKIAETNGPMYFYDPNTDAYYAVQKVKAMGSYIEGIPYNPRLISEKQQKIKDENVDVIENNEAEENSVSNENMENDDETDHDINSAEAIENNKESVEATNENTPKVEPTDDNEETLRNVLGSFMRDDPFNRQRQRTKPKKSNLKDKVLKSKPRTQLNYYFLLDVN